MNTTPEMTIAAVERETGIGKDTLRVWERRYGFPSPLRDKSGERLYPALQVDELRLIKRLIDQGHRPGRLFSLDAPARRALLVPVSSPAFVRGEHEDRLIRQSLDLLKTHDIYGLRRLLQQTMLRQDLQSFVLGPVTALNQAVGDAWMRGELEVFEEHLYSEQMKALLRQAISRLPSDPEASPRILLTTLPDEQHGIALLMAECLFLLAGAQCISLGTQTPLLAIQHAALAHRTDIVALSFSPAFPSRQRLALLAQLRAMLPAGIALWAGCAVAGKVEGLDGITALPTLETGLAALAEFSQQPRASAVGASSRAG